MKKTYTLLWTVVVLTTLFACGVPKKLLDDCKKTSDSLATELQKQLANQKALTDTANQELAALRAENAALKNQIDELNKQLDFIKQNYTALLQNLKDLSVVSGAQAESIKKSLDNISGKDAYIMDVQKALARKDSLNLILVSNLKGAIGNMDDKDIDIKVEKSAVYIDISDKLLFATGRYSVSKKAEGVLGKVAKVLKAQPDMEFLVEGNTDNVPYSDGVLIDNWDLSAKRATAIVRILQKKYGLNPKNITAAGRGEYHPAVANDTKDNKQLNRRTRIIILPQLDQFFNLLEAKQP